MKALVYSREHRGFWKQSRNGYTPRLSEAGCFSLLAAKAICDDANRLVKDGEPPEETLVIIDNEPARVMEGQLTLPNISTILPTLE